MITHLESHILECEVKWALGSIQSSSVQSVMSDCNRMNHSTPGLPVYDQLLESTQSHVYRVGDAIQPSHSPLSPSPPALNLSQHQGLFKWVSSLYQVVKALLLIKLVEVIELCWAISNPKRQCCESTAFNTSANLENLAVAPGLEKVSFHSSPKEGQCQRMLKPLQNCSHFTY